MGVTELKGKNVFLISIRVVAFTFKFNFFKKYFCKLKNHAL